MESPPRTSSQRTASRLMPAVCDKVPTGVSRGTQTQEFEDPASLRKQGSLSGLPQHLNINQRPLVPEPTENIPVSENSLVSDRRAQLAFTMTRSSGPSSSGSKSSAVYQLVSPGFDVDPRAMSQNNKDQVIQSLQTHKVNTITELRRIEKILAYLDSSEVTEPMTAAWAYYVNSNNLLNELRGLTRSYPFSSECLDEAKALVVRDPQRVRSWNYCWLVLLKMEEEGLVAKHAHALASEPAMWGGNIPMPDGVQRLADVFIAEWTGALRQMLRHWDRAPSTTGN